MTQESGVEGSQGRRSDDGLRETVPFWDRAMEEGSLAILCPAGFDVVCLGVGLTPRFLLALGGWRVFCLNFEEPVSVFVEDGESRLFSPLLQCRPGKFFQHAVDIGGL